ncbi:hypothetical protein E6O75_ATG10720 [Venturia nashicola]|uniref:Uncharacterized protein n=1 Tax=Venturia nashicola TaxID=86259 RepID=A0A4Z1P9Q2_9PEZI|nr:hypothetical protein E6O75_ATG10720 [Venturia nashicola]
MSSTGLTLPDSACHWPASASAFNKVKLGLQQSQPLPSTKSISAFNNSISAFNKVNLSSTKSISVFNKVKLLGLGNRSTTSGRVRNPAINPTPTTRPRFSARQLLCFCITHSTWKEAQFDSNIQHFASRTPITGSDPDPDVLLLHCIQQIPGIQAAHPSALALPHIVMLHVAMNM